MWNYIIKPGSVSQNPNGDADVILTFTADDGRTLDVPYTIGDPNNIYSLANDKIGQLTSADNQASEVAAQKAALAAFIANPPVGQPMPPIVAPPPSAQEQYNSDLQALITMGQQKSAKGIDLTADQEYLDLQALVNSEYDPAFTPLPADTAMRLQINTTIKTKSIN